MENAPKEPFMTFATPEDLKNYEAGLRGKIEAQIEAEKGKIHVANMQEYEHIFKEAGIEYTDNKDGLKKYQFLANWIKDAKSKLELTTKEKQELEQKTKEYEGKLTDFQLESQIDIALALHSSKLTQDDFTKEAILSKAKETIKAKIKANEVNSKENRPYTAAEIAAEIFGKIGGQPSPTNSGKTNSPNPKDVVSSYDTQEAFEIAMKQKGLLFGTTAYTEEYKKFKNK